MIQQLKNKAVNVMQVVVKQLNFFLVRSFASVPIFKLNKMTESTFDFTFTQPNDSTTCSGYSG